MTNLISIGGFTYTVARGQVTYVGGVTCPGSTNCASGYWSGSLDSTVLGDCTLSVSQVGTGTAVINGVASCTTAGDGSVTGTYNESTRQVDVTMNLPARGLSVRLRATLDFPGNNFVSGTWTCACGTGAFTLSRGDTFAAELVAAVDGGALTTSAGDQLTIPPGALPQDALVTATLQPVPEEFPPGQVALQRAYHFGPDGTVFNAPITAVFHYTSEDLAGGLIDPSTLKVYVWDSIAGAWSLVGGVVDTNAMTITVELTHFSDYAIFANMPVGIDGDIDAVHDSIDNCATVANPTQTNADGNFIDLPASKAYDDLTRANSDAEGDACDADDDNDGRADSDELAGTACGAFASPTNPLAEDSDGDRVIDGWECSAGTDPNDGGSKPSNCHVAGDADTDGVADSRERCFYGTSTANANSDGDTLTDDCEIASINGDLLVNVVDLQQVAQSVPPSGTAGYILDFDVNKDGSINVLDLQFVAARSVPCP